MRNIYCIYFFILFALVFLSQPLFAQNTKTLQKDSTLMKITNVDSRIKEFIKIDTIGGIAFRQMVDSLLSEYAHKAPRNEKGLLLIPENNWIPFANNISFRDTVIFDPKFLPVVFDGKVLPDDLSFLSEKSSFVSPNPKYKYHLIDSSTSIIADYNKSEEIKERRRSFYTANPDHVYLDAFSFAKNPIVKDNSIKKVNIFDRLLKTDELITIAEKPELDKVLIRTSKWRIVGDHSLSASFNHISSNWNGGGNSSYGGTSRQIINFDYKHDKLSIKNTLDWKLRMQKLKGLGTNDDGKKPRDYTVIEDYIKLESTLGINAFYNWSYSLKLNVQTPMFNAIKLNSNYRVRAFLSPLDLDIGPGMSYSLDKKSSIDKYRNLKLELDILPFIFKYRYIRSKAINVKDYGIEVTEKTLNPFEGKEHLQPYGQFKSESWKNYKWERGTQVQMKATVNFNKFCSLRSQAKLFTNYSYTLFEWENIVKYELNRYLAVTLQPYYRFDDESINKKSDNSGYSQLNLAIEFGVQYKW